MKNEFSIGVFIVTDISRETGRVDLPLWGRGWVLFAFLQHVILQEGKMHKKLQNNEDFL